MTELLDVSAEHRVLEIGTGSGYQAAVLAPLAREVFSIEIVGPLAAEASAIIGKLGLKNVTIRNGDGYKGWPEKAPFDRIIVTAAPPEIPPVLIEQLKAGGKMVVPVGAQGQAQELLLIEKSADGKIRRRSTIPVLFVPMVKGK
jgi:protein-L-isoaspartate(D-aspartate) O-methyltransferase